MRLCGLHAIAKSDLNSGKWNPSRGKKDNGKSFENDHKRMMKATKRMLKHEQGEL